MAIQSTSFFTSSLIAAVAATTIAACGTVLTEEAFSDDEFAAIESELARAARAEPVAFVAVHMEAQDNNGDLAYQRRYWPTLGRLVRFADRHGVKLTLQFNPQWATYILSDTSRLQVLRRWEGNGHEIALHHHGPGHDDWNGYTNDTSMHNDPKYQGTVAEMMALVRQLPASGRIWNGGITNESTDWPRSVPFDTDGGPAASDLVSRPQIVTYRGRRVVQLRYRQYATRAAAAAPLSEVQTGWASTTRGQVLGVIFHVHDFAQRFDQIRGLFSWMSSEQVPTSAVEAILRSRRPSR